MSFDYIFFDLDGTLTDPKIGITSSVMHALERYNFPIPDRNDLLFFIGPPLDESFMKYCGFDKEKAKEAVEVYREYYRPKGVFENDVYDGVIDMLDALKNAGKKLIMATSKPEYFANQIAEKYGFDKFFDNITGSTMDGSIVKKADVLTLALERLGLTDTSNCVMVGDRLHDIEGGHTKGMYTISVMYGYGSKEEFLEYKTDKIVYSVEELKEYLLNN